jgi:hypothetical protein
MPGIVGAFQWISTSVGQGVGRRVDAAARPLTRSRPSGLQSKTWGTLPLPGGKGYEGPIQAGNNNYILTLSPGQSEDREAEMAPCFTGGDEDLYQN